MSSLLCRVETVQREHERGGGREHQRHERRPQGASSVRIAVRAGFVLMVTCPPQFTAGEDVTSLFRVAHFVDEADVRGGPWARAAERCCTPPIMSPPYAG